MLLRHKIFLAITLALVCSVVLRPFIPPIKENKHIPTAPISMNIALTQISNNVLRMKSIGLSKHYPSDYQSGFDSNYYEIILLKDNEVLFRGKTVRSYEIISEEFDDTAHGQVTTTPLGNFELNLPYYKDATTLLITDDKGIEALRADLTEYSLIEPEASQSYCGDGICSDSENILMCVSDCVYRSDK